MYVQLMLLLSTFLDMSILLFDLKNIHVLKLIHLMFLKIINFILGILYLTNLFSF